MLVLCVLSDVDCRLRLDRSERHEETSFLALADGWNQRLDRDRTYIRTRMRLTRLFRLYHYRHRSCASVSIVIFRAHTWRTYSLALTSSQFLGPGMMSICVGIPCLQNVSATVLSVE